MDQKKIRLNDKTFKPFISNEQIEAAIDRVAGELNRDFEGSKDVPVLLCILNGSILFTAELMKRISFNVELISMKLSSYVGTRSTGKVREVMGLTGSVEGKRVIITEDIVDTGNTIEDITRLMKERGATEVRVCTMLFKPAVYTKDVKLDYVGMEIPNDFIVGFGLDYDEIGRNLKDIYVLDPEPDYHVIDGNMKYYVLFGPPGAGKGTQASSMVEKYGLCHLSTGALLRAEIAEGSELGKKASKLIENGQLVPDEVVEGMIENKFASEKGYNGFLLDGFPRTMAQAEALDRMLEKTREQVTACISLMIPDEMIVERISHRAQVEGRSDDASIETIKNRISTYHSQTEPLIEFYKKQGKYFEVDGTGTIDEVRERIFATMDRL